MTDTEFFETVDTDEDWINHATGTWDEVEVRVEMQLDAVDRLPQDGLDAMYRMWNDGRSIAETADEVIQWVDLGPDEPGDSHYYPSR